jgi:hypothetical protein
LLLRLAGGLDGLSALEVGVEHLPSIAGFFAQPFVIVRVREDSPAQRALPESVRWQRGRRADERVAVLKALLPNVTAVEALVHELSNRLSAAGAPRVRSRSRKTAASASIAGKLGIASPAHNA